jgi:HNH endonuclease
VQPQHEDTEASSSAPKEALESLPANVAAKIQPQPDDGCWIWTGAQDSQGYGNVRVGRSVRKAHRVVYEHVNGPVALDLDCDHLCRQPSCVRPSHIEPVSHADNVRRGRARTVPGARQRAKTHCPQGHPYDLGNTYVQPSTGGRCCRACDREKKRRRSEEERLCA